MERFSVWKDCTDASYEEVKGKINSFNEQSPEFDEVGYTLKRRVEFLSEDQKFAVDSHELEYCLLHIVIERVNNNSINPDNKNHIDSFECHAALINFEEQVFILALRGSTPQVKSNLRTILGYKGQGQNNKLTALELIDTKNDDFFYWIFNKTHNEKNQIVNEEYSIKFVDLVGFKGKTENESTVATSGSKILEILSTLAFIFENEQTIHVTTEISYTIDGSNSRTTIGLSQSGTHRIEENLYDGPHLRVVEETNKSMHVITRVLCEYIFIIHPKLHGAFLADTRSGIWSKSAKLTFIQTLGTNISSRVSTLVDSIKEEIHNAVEDKSEGAEE